jgi:UDP-2,3-diacylglucosamine hydrolase
LAEVKSNPGARRRQDVHLFLLGDIFDFWLSGHEVFVRKFYPVIEPIKKLIKQGVQVYFFEGNHDLHLHPYWRDQLGAQVFTEAQYFQLGPWKVRCEHGDLINQDDKAYLRMRATFRHPLVEALGHKLPGPMWEKIGNFFSQKSRRHSSSYREDKEKQLIEMIRQHARHAYAEKPFDLIVTGHMHVRDDFSFQAEKPVRSINLGSWFGEAQALKLTDKGVEWISLE